MQKYFFSFKTIYAFFSTAKLLYVSFFYSLSHCVDSGTFSVRNRGVGCALAWVTIAMTLNPIIHSILWGNSTGFVHVTNFLSSYRIGDYVAIVF